MSMRHTSHATRHEIFFKQIYRLYAKKNGVVVGWSGDNVLKENNLRFFLESQDFGCVTLFKNCYGI